MSERNTLIDTSTITIIDLAYLAGLIDGDGSFHISKRKGRGYKHTSQCYGMVLSIHCIERSLIDWVVSKFGGITTCLNKKPPRRSLYGVEITGNRLTQLIELILPFIKLKKPHAENMLKMRKTYNGIGGRFEIPKEVSDLREECWAFSREINSHKPIPKN